MKTIFKIVAIGVFASAAFAQENEIPRHELAFELGGFAPLSRSASQQSVDLSSGVALQANYAHLIVGGRSAALYADVHLLANPQRTVTSDQQLATRDVATLFATPGIRLKFRPTSRVSPYLAAGGGLAWFEHSTKLLNGSPNPVGRELLRGAFDFGGGVDIPVWRFVAMRGEVRDFYTGSPNYNLPAIHGGQNNVVAGGGFVIRWR